MQLYIRTGVISVLILQYLTTIVLRVQYRVLAENRQWDLSQYKYEFRCTDILIELVL